MQVTKTEVEGLEAGQKGGLWKSWPIPLSDMWIDFTTFLTPNFLQPQDYSNFGLSPPL